MVTCSHHTHTLYIPLQECSEDLPEKKEKRKHIVSRSQCLQVLYVATVLLFWSHITMETEWPVYTPTTGSHYYGIQCYRLLYTPGRNSGIAYVKCINKVNLWINIDTQESSWDQSPYSHSMGVFTQGLLDMTYCKWELPLYIRTKMISLWFSKTSLWPPSKAWSLLSSSCVYRYKWGL